MLNRECTETYRIPDTETIIEKGTGILIPVFGIHYDENYFPEPNEFNPQRFFVKKPFTEMPFLGFGIGQRSCIGARLGRLQSKVALAMLLQKYVFELADDWDGQDPTFSPKCLLTTPEGGINLKVRSRI